MDYCVCFKDEIYLLEILDVYICLYFDMIS